MPDEEPAPSKLPSRREWLRRLAPILLVLAVLLVLRTLRPTLPRDQHLAFDLGAAAPEVTRIDVTFDDPRRPGEEPAVASTWNFARGTAPRVVATTVRLHDGEWDLDIRVERASDERTTRIARRVTLEGGETVIHLEPALR